jgi:hypothetical protein
MCTRYTHDTCELIDGVTWTRWIISIRAHHLSFMPLCKGLGVACVEMNTDDDAALLRRNCASSRSPGPWHARTGSITCGMRWRHRMGAHWPSKSLIPSIQRPVLLAYLWIDGAGMLIKFKLSEPDYGAQPIFIMWQQSTTRLLRWRSSDAFVCTRVDVDLSTEEIARESFEPDRGCNTLIHRLDWSLILLTNYNHWRK